MFRAVVLLGLAAVLLVNARPTNIPCGLPSFVEKLNETSANEIKAIWKDYKDGDDCEDQQNKTFKVISGISRQEIDAVFAAPIVDVFDDVPNFIRSMSIELRKEFDSIWMNRDISEDERLNKLEKLASTKFTKDQKVGFDTWTSQLKDARKEIEDKMNNLSKEAKEILNELTKVRNEEKKIISRITPEIGKELHGLI
ncbi:unnamed protein product [Auanema sp. JU1783]|nr:unnamed protein product [Auanema sp. JU1783]